MCIDEYPGTRTIALVDETTRVSKVEYKRQKRGEAGSRESHALQALLLCVALLAALMFPAPTSIVVLEGFAFVLGLVLFAGIVKDENGHRALQLALGSIALLTALACVFGTLLLELALTNLVLAISSIFPALRAWFAASLMAGYSAFMLAVATTLGSAPSGLFMRSSWSAVEFSTDRLAGGWAALSWCTLALLVCGTVGVLASGRWRNRAALLLVLAFVTICFASAHPAMVLIAVTWGLLLLISLGAEGAPESGRLGWYVTLACVAMTEIGGLAGWLATDAYFLDIRDLSPLIATLDHNSQPECQSTLSTRTHGLTEQQLAAEFPASAAAWRAFESLQTVDERRRAISSLVQMLEEDAELASATIVCRWQRLSLRRDAHFEFNRRWDLSRDASERVQVHEERTRSYLGRVRVPAR